MSDRPKLAIIAGAIIVLAVAFFALRPGDDDASAPTGQDTTEAAGTPTATTTPSAGTATTAATQPASPPPASAAHLIRVRGGQPVGGAKTITVQHGDRVRLDVRADTAEEVHLHGYDIAREVGPGRVAHFNFRADAEGAFEIELEHSAVKIADLEVRPR